MFTQVKWWAPCIFLSKMGSSEERALIKFKWFFVGTFLGPHCYSKNSAANRDLNSTFFLEPLGGKPAGHWKATYLEKSHHTAGSVASESSPLCEASIVLEHVTPWVTRHHSFGLANEMAWLVALKMDP